jgi:hypothetical protein
MCKQVKKVIPNVERNWENNDCEGEVKSTGTHSSHVPTRIIRAV